MNYEIKIFSKLEPELKKYWKNSESNSFGFCFQDYDWFENWFNHYRKNNKNFFSCIVVVFQNSEICCVLPFEIRNIWKVKILQWMGNKQIDYNSPVLNKKFLTNEKEFSYLWKNIINALPKFDLIYLQKQPENIDGVKNPFVTYLNNNKHSNVFLAILPKTWDEYSKTYLKKKFVSDNLRTKKLIKQLGSIKFKIANEEEQKYKYLEEIIFQKNKKLSLQGLKNVFDENDLSFYKEFEIKKLTNIKTQIAALILNEDIIALSWGIIYKNRYYYLLPSMKIGIYERYSPGKLLISLLIKWSISKKIRIFDFALGQEEYKKKWSNNVDVLYNHLKSYSLIGFIFSLILNINLKMRKIFRKQ